jgi:(p)ppGpp synthase/HD superfamily hydrolase
MPSLEDALALAVEAHRGQQDKAGDPYILHPLRLMLRFDDEAARLVALLHDVAEDSDTSLDDLRAEGYPEAVLAALDCLTHHEGEAYADYIQRIKPNPLARRVKLADLEDNMNLARLSRLAERDIERLQKYHNAWQELRLVADDNG